MTISEVATLLGIPESYINEYIRVGLIPNHHHKDTNTFFSESDIQILKEVIILRKLNWGSLDIYDGYYKKKDLLKITKSLLEYEDKETEKTKIYQMILDDNSDVLNVERYWELTCNCEELNKNYNEPFSSFSSYKKFTKNFICQRLGFDSRKIRIRKYILILITISFGAELIKRFVFHRNNNILFGTVYPLLIISLIIIVSFLVFISYRLLGARISNFIFNIFMIIVALFFIAIILLAIIALFNTIQNWIINTF